MIFALVYSLTSPVVGVLLDYGFSTSKLLILGGVCSSLACFLLGRGFLIRVNIDIAIDLYVLA